MIFFSKFFIDLKKHNQFKYFIPINMKAYICDYQNNVGIVIKYIYIYI